MYTFYFDSYFMYLFEFIRKENYLFRLHILDSMVKSKLHRKRSVPGTPLITLFLWDLSKPLTLPVAIGA